MPTNYGTYAPANVTTIIGTIDGRRLIDCTYYITDNNSWCQAFASRVWVLGEAKAVDEVWRSDLACQKTCQSKSDMIGSASKSGALRHIWESFYFASGVWPLGLTVWWKCLPWSTYGVKSRCMLQGDIRGDSLVQDFPSWFRASDLLSASLFVSLLHQY